MLAKTNCATKVFVVTNPKLRDYSGDDAMLIPT